MNRRMLATFATIMPSLAFGQPKPLHVLPGLWAVPQTFNKGEIVSPIRYDATAFGSCIWDGAHDVAPCVQAALNAVPAAGGIVFIPAGTYPVTAVSNIKSNTHVLCMRGTVFQPTASYGATKFVLSNVNYAAGSIIDHDIIIEDCTFDMTKQDNGGFHAIDIRMTQHVQVLRPNCIKGGDCTAMEATDDTVVADGNATKMLNACWDHWDAPTHGVVRGGEMLNGRHGECWPSRDRHEHSHIVSRYRKRLRN